MLMDPSPRLSHAPYPAQPAVLEEVCAAAPGHLVTAFAFALSRVPEGARPVVFFATSRAWLAEHGRPYGRGLTGIDLILAVANTGAEGLWAMEQALRSGAVTLALGGIEAASLAQTRRLGFAAQEGGAVGVMLRLRHGGLSAARRRWRIASVASAMDPADLRAPGAGRLWAELVRSRSERPGTWILEQADETHRLRLADRLAGDGPGAIGRTTLAA
ncbi:MAG: protein ImuA [Brevundimonas sp.]|jgi:protein ImuA